MKKEKTVYYIIILIVIFFLQFFFISSIGEFALNDDWVHTYTIKHWAETGEFKLMPYAGPTFYFPILYGTALVKIFGFSFSLLRLSSLFFSLATLIFFFLFLNKITNKKILSFLAVLLLWSNPLFYNLSFTFMTDIPALFLLVCSALCYYLAFEKKQIKWIFFGSFISIIGFYTRQTNILMLVAAGLYSLKYVKEYKFKNLLWSFGIPLLFGAVIYYYLSQNYLLPQNTNSHLIKSLPKIFEHSWQWIWFTLFYLGLFILPLTISFVAKNRTVFKKLNFYCLIFSLLSVYFILGVFFKINFPYVKNMISVFGLGPMREVLNGDLIPYFSSNVGMFIGAIGALGAGIMVYVLLLKNKIEQPIGYLYWFAGLYLIPILLFESFDRYFLPLVFSLTTIQTVRLKDKKISYPLMAVLIAIIGLFSFTQTRYYLGWNKARWELANKIFIEEKIKPNQIDAGYEWNGWNAYWLAVESGRKRGTETSPWWIREIFVNNTEDYIVSFSPIAPYKVIDSKVLPRFNPNRRIYLLEKP